MAFCAPGSKNSATSRRSGQVPDTFCWRRHTPKAPLSRQDAQASNMFRRLHKQATGVSTDGSSDCNACSGQDLCLIRIHFG